MSNNTLKHKSPIEDCLKKTLGFVAKGFITIINTSDDIKCL